MSIQKLSDWKCIAAVFPGQESLTHGRCLFGGFPQQPYFDDHAVLLPEHGPAPTLGIGSQGRSSRSVRGMSYSGDFVMSSIGTDFGRASIRSRVVPQQPAPGSPDNPHCRGPQQVVDSVPPVTVQFVSVCSLELQYQPPKSRDFSSNINKKPSISSGYAYV